MRARLPSGSRSGSARVTPRLDVVEPFSLLPPSARRAAENDCRALDVPRGYVFFEEGDPAGDAYLVRRGRVRIHHSRPDGSVRAVCISGPGEFFCCLPILDRGPQPATAVAAVPTTVLRFPVGLLNGLIRAHPRFTEAIVGRICASLRLNLCRDLGTDAGSRLAARLLAMSEKFGNTVRLTRRELGELAGTTVETAIREIKRFERAGWVELGRGQVRIRDRGALLRRRARLGSDGRDPR